MASSIDSRNKGSVPRAARRAGRTPSKISREVAKVSSRKEASKASRVNRAIRKAAGSKAANRASSKAVGMELEQAWIGVAQQQASDVVTEDRVTRLAYGGRSHKS